MTDLVRIDDIIARSEQPVFSFEFFPPRSEEGERNLREALEKLVPLQPSFVSITYGAGGSTRDLTVELTRWMKQELGLEAMSHLTSIGSTRKELRKVLDRIAAGGIDNVLALRGDVPADLSDFEAGTDMVATSAELIELIVSEYSFCVGAACFPEVHPEAVDLNHEIRVLKAKADAGARFFITQLFFDNQLYFDYLKAAGGAGVRQPIIPGLMPITSVEQIKRFTSLCGATIPDPLLDELESLAGDPTAVLELGVAYATEQAAGLLAGGAPGIHFYTLNRSPATREILSALRIDRPWERSGAAEDRRG
jgi:methylenetetrahydrofolate reductase (NADPH)